LAGKRPKEGGVSGRCAVIWGRFRGGARREKWNKLRSNGLGRDAKGCLLVLYPLGDLLRVQPVRQPLAIHIAALQEQTVRTILLDKLVAENFGQQSEPAPSPNIDLPQAIACRIEALHEKIVLVSLNVNMRHAPLVDDDFSWLLQAVNFVGLVCEDQRGYQESRTKKQIS